ncbi:hypothetical protein HU200_006427 [Digitaria exilis]|uniref:Uncharacterized protein n=1 Tax=Digitaria exilis TaxID=1010633 RepID=A0A835KRU9_9POAL|nr:hypothetical protein HU200_006427 [Digitaria exilis]
MAALPQRPAGFLDLVQLAVAVLLAAATTGCLGSRPSIFPPCGHVPPPPATPPSPTLTPPPPSPPSTLTPPPGGIIPRPGSIGANQHVRLLASLCSYSAAMFPSVVSSSTADLPALRARRPRAATATADAAASAANANAVAINNTDAIITNPIATSALSSSYIDMPLRLMLLLRRDATLSLRRGVLVVGVRRGARRRTAHLRAAPAMARLNFTTIFIVTHLGS